MAKTAKNKWLYRNSNFVKVQMPNEDSCYNGLKSFKNMSIPVDKIDMKGVVEAISLDLDKLFSK